MTETNTPLVADNGLPKDSDADSSLEKTPGHQGGNSTGGISENMRVVFCSNLDFTMNFEVVELLTKQFGKIERIRIKCGENETSLESYIVYEKSTSALAAHAFLNGHEVNDSKLNTKLYNVLNLKDDPFDYYPKDLEISSPTIIRKVPTPVWFVASYKDGKENYVKASEKINLFLNGIPKGNIKKYGKNILIKAKNSVQSKLLKGYKPLENSNIGSITPHRSFNCTKGIIYSKDLSELEEKEILKRSPPSIYEVKKLKGTNNVIMLYFSTEYLPDYVNFGDHVRMRVHRFKASPKQCRKCLEYGHLREKCENTLRCSKCSGNHVADTCNNEMFCFLCDERHNPTSNVCARKKFEREVIETAEVERISIGSAKRKIMGANRDQNSTYAKVMKKMKETPFRNPVGRVDKEKNKDVTKSTVDPSYILHQSENINVGASSSTDQQKEGHKEDQSENIINEGASSSTDQQKECHKEDRSNRDNRKKNNSDHTVDEDGFMLPKEKRRRHPTYPSQAKSSGKSESKGKSSGKSEKVIDEDGFEFPSDKKRGHPVSPPSSSKVEVRNSFSLLEEIPSKNQALSSNGENLSNGSQYCRPREKQIIQNPQHSHSTDSLKSCGESHDEMDVTDSEDKVLQPPKEVKTSKVTHLNNLDIPVQMKSPSPSNPKTKRLTYHFKSFKDTSQARSKSDLARHKK